MHQFLVGVPHNKVKGSNNQQEKIEKNFPENCYLYLTMRLCLPVSKKLFI